MPLTPEHIADAWTHGCIAGVAVWQVVVGLRVVAPFEPSGIPDGWPPDRATPATMIRYGRCPSGVGLLTLRAPLRDRSPLLADRASAIVFQSFLSASGLAETLATSNE